MTTDDTDTTDIQERREAFADAFDRDLDPLRKFEAKMRQVPFDPFTLYWDAVIETKGLATRSKETYRRVYDEWKRYMNHEHDRHPACPSESHVAAFIDWQSDEKGNADRTVMRKVYALDRAYQYWQDEDGLPHPIDSNPFASALAKAGLNERESKKQHRIEIATLQEYVDNIGHIRNQAFVVTGLKLGLRAGEIANIQLRDIHLPDEDVLAHYPQMASCTPLEDRESAIYIPHDREGNKSKRPRVLPLDDEMRTILTKYLLIRPDIDEPWLFLAKEEPKGISNQAVNAVWKEHFRPEYDETERYAAVTSHYARHRFTTHFEKTIGLDPIYVDYMRGDKMGEDFENRTATDYTHVYYDDVRDLYLDEMDGIYKLNV